MQQINQGLRGRVEGRGVKVGEVTVSDRDLTDHERLEEIKKVIDSQKESIRKLGVHDITWLISTVEEQQKELSQLGEELGQWEGLELDFKEERERLQKEIEWLKLQSLSVKEIVRHSESKDEEIARLRKALDLIIETSNQAYVRRVAREALKE